MTTSLTSNSASTVELKPSYNIPVVLIIGSIPLFVIHQPVAGGIIALLGLFLMYQTVTLRLQFTATDLDIVRGDNLLRRFPYAEWQNWRIFWNVVPILFYFKEIKSIHFLPILFDAKTLKACLEEHCSRID
ncbi:MAG: DUF3119 family protein [Cyanobacteria bacterium P01_D01_bin.50]